MDADGHINIRTDSKEIGKMEHLFSESIGISNVIHRLRIYYQEEVDIMVKSNLVEQNLFLLFQEKIRGLL